MPVSTPHVSRTAERAFGHGQFTGSPSRVSSAKRASANRGYVGPQPRVSSVSVRPAPGHRQFSGTPRNPDPVDRQVEAIAERDHERRRLALWASCERRPFAMDRSKP
jgi:hypothetical protein